MADGQPGNSDLTTWRPNPRAFETPADIGWSHWERLLREFMLTSTSGYYINYRDCYHMATKEDELAVRQWKAWELYLARAKLMGEL